jgi:hypothetical protein
MYNPAEDDSELDRLSRNAADGYEVPVNANWQTMMQQLNKAMPEENRRRFGFLWWMVPALLMVGGVSSYYLFKKQPGEIAIASNKALVPAKQSPVPVSGKSISPTILSATESKNLIDIPQPLPAQEKNIPATSEPKAIAEKETAGQKLQTNEAAALEKAHSDVITAPRETVINNPAAVAERETTEQKQQTNETVALQKDSTAINAPEKKEETAIIKTTKRKTAKQWSIAIMGGVDESTVKLRYAYDPGYNIGMMAGYHFSKKLSLHTGAIYTQKNYKIAGSDFTAPKDSWLSRVNLQTIEGYCRMWEVPLLIRYTLSSTAKKSFFLSTGLSSYFMTVENYEYAYLYNGQQMVRNSNYNSSDTRILSIAHLSAGFENNIGKHLFLQVEPYAKIPLGGIGFGNIKLSSFGINVAIQRRQPFGK